MRADALARAGRGDDAGAARVFADAVARFPGDAALMNSAGNFHASAGRPAEALALFERALAIAPSLGEAAINRAVVLTSLGRAMQAADDLAAGATRLAGLPRYWTARAAAEVAAGRLAAAAGSYDAALARQPTHPRALHGRARVALDRGEEQAVGRYDRALAATPGDPQLLLGLAQALDAAGERAEALRISAALVAALPGWVAALELHATLRWADGDRAAFCDHYADAAQAAGDVAIHRSWATMVAGVDRHAEAAEIAAAARRGFGEDRTLRLMEAIYRGEAGDLAGAAAIFAAEPHPDADWQMSEARLRLTTGDPARAAALLEAAIAAAPADVTAWSLLDLCWRVLGDARHAWLHGQEGLIREMALDLDADAMAAACAVLDALHDHAAMPIGQSVKDGSQTRGALFDRTEPAIARVATAIGDAVERYRAALPPADPRHPLLRHRDAPWRIAGSWSIRLAGKGRHAPHIHSSGVISSAAYFIVPDAIDDPDRPGWLELGGPPPALGLDLSPLAIVRPRPGQCVLFPSTLYHGTRPIAAGKRMTVAFDVIAAAEA